MSPRAARTLFWTWVVGAAVFLCFPGIVPFNRVRPLVLGLPFVMAWVASWIVFGLVVFYVADRTLGRRPPGSG